MASTLYTQRLQQHMATHTERLAKETERRASSEGQLQRLDKELTALRAAQRVADMDTGAFLKSLTVPHTLGRWGELSLRRIVELSGMQQHVDFDEQITVLDKEGDVFRVDMVVKMHSKRYIVVDSKVPLNAFEETLAAKDEKEERAKMKKYSAAIRKHVLELRSLPPLLLSFKPYPLSLSTTLNKVIVPLFLGCSNKKYFNHFDPSPDFVVAFLPCEAFYSVALREDPGIIEYCLDKKVVLASPVTLIALLKVIEFGWRQGDLAENHEEVRRFHRALAMFSVIAHINRSHCRSKASSRSSTTARCRFPNTLRTWAGALTRRCAATTTPSGVWRAACSHRRGR